MKKLTADGDYTMPVLSEQEKQELISFAKVVSKDWGKAGPHSKLIQIALASLTAEPVGYGFREDIDLMKKGQMVNGAMTVRCQGEQALFTATPVPVKQEGEQ